jgi:hypothetical protein
MDLSASVRRGTIPCLSVRQPWAWALLHGKDVENRAWSHSYTGPVILHASAQLPNRDFFYDDCELVARRTGVMLPDEISLGAVIGVIEILKIVRDSKSPWAADGQYHWCSEPIIELAEPIEMKGELKLFWIRDVATLVEIADQIHERVL